MGGFWWNRRSLEWLASSKAVFWTYWTKLPEYVFMYVCLCSQSAIKQNTLSVFFFFFLQEVICIRKAICSLSIRVCFSVRHASSNHKHTSQFLLKLDRWWRPFLTTRYEGDLHFGMKFYFIFLNTLIWKRTAVSDACPEGQNATAFNIRTHDWTHQVIPQTWIGCVC